MARPDRVRIRAASPFRDLGRALSASKGRLALAAFAYLVKDSPIWVLPVITAAVIDSVVAGTDPLRILLLGLGGAALVVLNYPSSLLWVRLFSGTVRDLGVTLRNELAHHVQQLSIGFHNRSTSSVIQTKVVRDVENVELMLLQGANPLLGATGVLLGAGTVIALQVPQFLILFALIVPISVALIRWMKARSQTRNEVFRKDVERFSSRVSEMAALLRITRAHSLEPIATERVVSSARTLRDSGYLLDVVNGRFQAFAWIAFQLLSIGCLVGTAVVAVTGVLPVTPGQVVLLSTYFVSLTNSIVNLFNLTPLLTRGRESLRSIAEVLEEPDLERNEGRRVLPDVRGDLRFEGVGMRYPGDSEPAVHDIHLRIEAGETVAFVGPSGSGKSTILNLVLGFLRPTEGRILLDGVPMEELDLRSVRRRVSVVPQDSVLFDGTLRENVVYGLTEVGDEQLRRALADANALDFVSALPEGLDTVLGESGARLSGGQRQRISIARALIRNPRILLLDEATSALDSEAEASIRDALDRLRSGRTTLVVAHRLSTIRSADRIVVLENGRIVEVGSHSELLGRNGRYARLHDSQAG